MTHRLLAVLAVYQEAALIGRAIRSLAGLGVDELHVFDGAWRGGRDGNHPFGKYSTSTDGTLEAAAKASADLPGVTASWHNQGAGDFWPSQEAKRTAMFHDVGAEQGDFVLVLDADEEVENTASEVDAGGQAVPLRDELPAIGGHANVLIRCEGPNDMPGVRGEWPAGDYSREWKPELRLFAWNPTLDCLHPGGYYSAGKRIEAYKRAVASSGDVDWGGGVASALPVVESCRIVHHGNDRDQERREQKLAYYEAEHPERLRWQRALEGTK